MLLFIFGFLAGIAVCVTAFVALLGYSVDQ